MKTLLHRSIILSLILALSSTLSAEDKVPKDWQIVIQAVGSIEKPLRVDIKGNMTIEDFFEIVKPTAFASRRSITVIRIAHVYNHTDESVITGTNKQFIDFRVGKITQLRDLKLKTGDIIYTQQKRPLSK